MANHHGGHTNTPRSSKKFEYQRFRVRGHIKSFRDLEIYRATTELSSQIYSLSLPAKTKGKQLLEGELAILRAISKQVPKLIAEGYGDKFTSRDLAYSKLEEAMRYISNLVTKLDFLITLVEHQDTKQSFVKLINKYQIQRQKILNLKRAWIKVAKRYDQVSD